MFQPSHARLARCLRCSVSLAALLVCFPVTRDVTAKAESPPALEWIRQFGKAGLPGNVGDIYAPRGLAVDELGNLFIAGAAAETVMGEQRAFSRKYDLAGNLQWSHEDKPPGGEAGGFDVWADGLGNAYFAGSKRTPRGQPFLTEFDSHGTLQWEYLGGASAPGSYHAIAGDGVGSLYLAGRGEGAVLAKHDLEGNLLWRGSFLEEGISDASDVAMDRDAGVYVSGSTTISGRGYDGFLTRFDDQGEQLWIRQFGTPDDDFATCVEVDALGNVFVAGEWEWEGVATNRGRGFVSLYNKDGELQWRRLLGSSNVRTVVNAVATDEIGNLYVAGYTNRDAFLQKLDATGNIVWDYLLNTSAFDAVTDLTVLPGGDLVLVGTTGGVLGGPKMGHRDGWVALLHQQSIPEPSATSLLLGGIALAAACCRRQATLENRS